jgi:fused signal recognition particle receptor
MNDIMYQIVEICKPLSSMQNELIWAASGLLVILLLLLFIRSAKHRKHKQAEKESAPSVGVGKVLETQEAFEEEKIEPDTVFDTESDRKPKAPPLAEEKGIDDEVVGPEGLVGRLRSGLSKTRNSISGGLERIFTGTGKLDEEALEDIEELLITSDVGVKTTMSIVQNVEKKASDIKDPDKLKKVVKAELLSVINESQSGPDKKLSAQPHVIMVVGVNGVGKTTTIGKIASRLSSEGKKVLIAAADTFRAAAVEQLSIWAERAGADIVKHGDNADPAAVAYDGVEAAIARKVDVVLVDTAGRLHTRVNLMEELKKVKRTIAKKLPDAPHEVLMVLDATTGQNALIQAEQFNEALGITNLALTKLDGTAKGGIVIGVCGSLNISLDYIGVGEGISDLQSFDPVKFIDALFV